MKKKKKKRNICSKSTVKTLDSHCFDVFLVNFELFLTLFLGVFSKFEKAENLRSQIFVSVNDISKVYYLLYRYKRDNELFSLIHHKYYHTININDQCLL